MLRVTSSVAYTVYHMTSDYYTTIVYITTVHDGQRNGHIIQCKYFVGYKFRGSVKILISWETIFADCKQNLATEL